MRKFGFKVAGALVGAALLTGVAVVPASAGNLYAYNSTNYGNEILNAPSASYIDVADNLTSSVKNLTSSRFSGRNVIGLWSAEVFSFSAGSSVSTLGGADNQIDHFDRQ